MVWLAGEFPWCAVDVFLKHRRKIRRVAKAAPFRHFRHIQPGIEKYTLGEFHPLKNEKAFKSCPGGSTKHPAQVTVER